MSFKLAFLLALAVMANADEEFKERYDDLDECPRFSLEELRATVIQPVLGRELHLLRETIYEGIDGIVEMMEGVEERNPQGWKVEATKIKRGNGEL